MPGYYTTNAIVLRRYNFGEADRIINLLSAEHGKIRAVAKGVRRMKSRMAGHLELFSHTQVQCAKGRSLDTITSARLVGAPQELSYDALQAAYLYAEMIDKLVGEGQPHDETYVVLQQTLDYLAGVGRNNRGELYFKLRLLGALGYEPHMQACTICGNAAADADYFFNADLGGIVDRRCMTAGNPAMSQRTIKLWRAVQRLSLEQIDQVVGAEVLAAESLPLVDSMYEHHFNKRFRSTVLG